MQDNQNTSQNISPATIPNDLHKFPKIAPNSKSSKSTAHNSTPNKKKRKTKEEQKRNNPNFFLFLTNNENLWTEPPSLESSPEELSFETRARYLSLEDSAYYRAIESVTCSGGLTTANWRQNRDRRSEIGAWCSFCGVSTDRTQNTTKRTVVRS